MKTPHPLTEAEWCAVARLREVQEAFGIDTHEPTWFETFKATTYAVRFDFMEGGPGYWGPLILVLGDALGPAPLMVTKDPATGNYEITPEDGAPCV